MGLEHILDDIREATGCPDGIQIVVHCIALRAERDALAQMQANDAATAAEALKELVEVKAERDALKARVGELEAMIKTLDQSRDVCRARLQAAQEVALHGESATVAEGSLLDCALLHDIADLYSGKAIAESRCEALEWLREVEMYHRSGEHPRYHDALREDMYRSQDLADAQDRAWHSACELRATLEAALAAVEG